MNLRKKIWCNVLYSWLIFGIFVSALHTMTFVVGKQSERLSFAFKFFKIPYYVFFEFSFLLVMAFILIFSVWRNFYTLYKIDRDFFGAEKFQWYWTDVVPYSVLKPIRHLAQHAPHIQPIQIKFALEDISSRLRKKTFSIIATISVFIFFNYSFYTFFIFFIKENPLSVILSVFTSFLALFVIFAWSTQCQRLNGAFMEKLSDWCWKNFSWPPTEEKNLSEPFLQSFLTQWMGAVEKIQHVIQNLEERHSHFHKSLLLFSEKTQLLSDLMKNQHTILYKWVDEQIQSRHSMEKISHRLGEGLAARDEELRESLKKLLIVSREILEKLSEHEQELFSSELHNTHKE